MSETAMNTGRRMKKTQLIFALTAALLISSGFYASTYTSSANTLNVLPTGNNVAEALSPGTPPDWSTVLSSLSSSNQTMGEVPSGDLAVVSPDSNFTGDLMAKVYLANSGDLAKAYSYLNMKVYMNGSVEAGQTPNYSLLTLQNGEASLSITDITGTTGTFFQTDKTDFDGGSQNQVETATSPGNLLLDTYPDDIIDSFTDASMIYSSTNLSISLGQVQLDSSGGGSNETIRPDSVGDKTNVPGENPFGGIHWTLVDEAVTDGDSTYIASTNGGWLEDLYNAGDHVTGSGVINYVKVYLVARAVPVSTRTGAYVLIKTNSSEYSGPEITLGQTYAAYSYQWNTNPQTGLPWTWSEIDALQVGAGLRASSATGGFSGRESRITQIYVEVNSASFNTSGLLQSVNLLSSVETKTIDSFDYYVSSMPSGTTLKAQFSQDATSWVNSAGTPGAFDTLALGSSTISLSALNWVGPNFYYRIIFTTSGVPTPVLDEININYTVYYLNGNLVSSAYDTGLDMAWDWGTISFTVTEPPVTDVKFQIRTASTEAGLGTATWYGPTGTSDYYQASGEVINPIHDGDRWIQYRAYLSGITNSSPVFSDITITYSAASAAYMMEIIGGSYGLVSDNTSEWGAGWTLTPEIYVEIVHR